ncbi:hypothetical protein RB2150_06793 [Rhodobacterales bacterium HTCC2150]|nr:hypothetical protein RB2150_06793 [Rhodobacterales bacterium HTCC2150] [Rhodobacteraceae bacterium HTCC2150]
MNQKSSIIQILNYVPKVLTLDTIECIDALYLWIYQMYHKDTIMQQAGQLPRPLFFKFL